MNEPVAFGKAILVRSNLTRQNISEGSERVVKSLYIYLNNDPQ